MKDFKPLKYCGQQWLGRPIQLLSSIYICKNTSFFNSYLKRRGRRGRRGNEGEKRRKRGKIWSPNLAQPQKRPKWPPHN